jgi:hypothetical protein
MKFTIRVDEHRKTDPQLAQRAATYEAARILRQHGIECEVREFFTGSAKDADAAGIFLKM